MITEPVPVTPHDTPKPRRSRLSARALRHHKNGKRDMDKGIARVRNADSARSEITLAGGAPGTDRSVLSIGTADVLVGRGIRVMRCSDLTSCRRARGCGRCQTLFRACCQVLTSAAEAPAAKAGTSCAPPSSTSPSIAPGPGPCSRRPRRAGPRTSRTGCPGTSGMSWCRHQRACPGCASHGPRAEADQDRVHPDPHSPGADQQTGLARLVRLGAAVLADQPPGMDALPPVKLSGEQLLLVVLLHSVPMVHASEGCGQQQSASARR